MELHHHAATAVIVAVIVRNVLSGALLMDQRVGPPFSVLASRIYYKYIRYNCASCLGSACRARPVLMARSTNEAAAAAGFALAGDGAAVPDGNLANAG